MNTCPLPPLLLRGDALAQLARIPSESIDAIVTDPPYGLSNTDPGHVVEALTRWVAGDRAFVPATGGGFMGKAWDSFVPPPAVWDECMRILKPGGHLLSFAGSRTHDLMTLSIRLAGFDIRDSIAWLYGSGFPKSMDVSKAIDKAAGATRERVPGPSFGSGGNFSDDNGATYVTRLANGALTDAAKAWEGWGTALKPAFEPVVVARKPFKGTVAANVLAHGTGALNIDATRIHTTGSEAKAYTVARTAPGATQNATGKTKLDGTTFNGKTKAGRWPANVVLDESQAAALDAQTGVTGANGGSGAFRQHAWMPDAEATPQNIARDKGGASRFFYVAKAPKSERPVVDGLAHPTVKPLALMRWLLRLVTPTAGVIVDPFAGSGTTLEAAYLEGFESIGVELTPDYWPLIEARIARVVGEDDEAA